MIRVIVVDDHPVVRRGLKQIISAEADMRVVAEADTAKNALSVIRATECDAVVLDITLPGASGLEVLQQLRPERPNLPVLILSMHEEEQYARRMLKAGAAGYLMKESAPEDLIGAIRKIAMGRKYISPSLAEMLAAEIASDTTVFDQKLSGREFQILCLIASGKSLKEIGETLCISGKTVSTYRARILEKLEMKSNAELVAYALNHNLIP
jgi:two-component system invasion response regulator UvrY